MRIIKKEFLEYYLGSLEENKEKKVDSLKDYYNHVLKKYNRMIPAAKTINPLTNKTIFEFLGESVFFPSSLFHQMWTRAAPFQLSGLRSKKRWDAWPTQYIAIIGTRNFVSSVTQKIGKQINRGRIKECVMKFLCGRNLSVSKS